MKFPRTRADVEVQPWYQEIEATYREWAAKVKDRRFAGCGCIDWANAMYIADEERWKMEEWRWCPWCGNELKC